MHTEEIATFITSLVNAGMSIEEAIKQGFALARECTIYTSDFQIASGREQMLAAAKLLEQASLKAGLHMNQQRA